MVDETKHIINIVSTLQAVTYTAVTDGKTTHYILIVIYRYVV
jgi:hypothetical protein